jgi:hypothetical protein
MGIWLQVLLRRTPAYTFAIAAMPIHCRYPLSRISSAGLHGARTALRCSRPVASGRGAAPPLSPCTQWAPAPLPSADTRETDDRRGVQAADLAAAELAGALDERSSVRPTPRCLSAL